jgi:hypothetical protein
VLRFMAPNDELDEFCANAHEAKRSPDFPRAARLCAAAPEGYDGAVELQYLPGRDGDTCSFVVPVEDHAGHRQSISFRLEMFGENIGPAAVAIDACAHH